jgi:hypothetical protein
MSPLNAAICTTISYTLWVEWYYLKNNYLTLRSKVKVPRRSWRYVTHRLMVMHPHTKYHWPILKDKKVMVRTSFAEKKRKKKIRLKQYVSPFVRRGDIIKRKWSLAKIWKFSIKIYSWLSLSRIRWDHGKNSSQP